ncbi:hypothetical protein ACJZTR_02190 [Neorickettsia risticii]
MPSFYNDHNAPPFATTGVPISGAFSEFKAVLSPRENGDFRGQSILVPGYSHSPTSFDTSSSSEDEDISEVKSLFSTSTSSQDPQKENFHFGQILSDAGSVSSSVTPIVEKDSSTREPEILIEDGELHTIPTLEHQHPPSYTSRVLSGITQNTSAALDIAGGYVQSFSSNLSGAFGGLMQGTSNALYAAGSYIYNSVAPVSSSVTPTVEEDSSTREPEILIEDGELHTIPTLEHQHPPSYTSRVLSGITQNTSAALDIAGGYVQSFSSNLSGAFGGLMQGTSNALYAAGSYIYNSVAPVSSSVTPTVEEDSSTREPEILIEDGELHTIPTLEHQQPPSYTSRVLSGITQNTSAALDIAGGYVQSFSSNLSGAFGGLMQGTSNALYAARSYIYNSNTSQTAYSRFQNYLGNGAENMRNGFSKVGKRILSSTAHNVVNSAFPESMETLQNLNRFLKDGRELSSRIEKSLISGINNAVTHLEDTSENVSAAAAAFSQSFNGTSLHITRLFHIFMELNNAVLRRNREGVVYALENMLKQVAKLQALCLLKSDTQENHKDKLTHLDRLSVKIARLLSVAKGSDTLYSWDRIYSWNRNKLYTFLELDKIKEYFPRSSNIQDTIEHMHGVIPRVRMACLDTSKSANSLSVISDNIKLFSLIGSVQILPLAAFVLRCSVNQDNNVAYVACAVMQALAVAIIFTLTGRYFQEAKLFKKLDNNGIASDHASVTKVCAARTIIIGAFSALPVALITLGIYTADAATTTKTHIALVSTLFVLSLALSIVLPVVYKVYPQRQEEAAPHTPNHPSVRPDSKTPPSTSIPSSSVATPTNRQR